MTELSGPQPGPQNGNLEWSRFNSSRRPPFKAKYSRYLDPTLSDESRMMKVFRELELSPTEQEKITAMLGPLKVKHYPTYAHCIRVGLLAFQIGRFCNLDAKALFYAGTLHDCGKALCSLELLEHTTDWEKAQQDEMRRHVEDGHRMLRGVCDFAADIMAWHHRFQENAYPNDPPKVLHEYSPDTRLKIPEYGRIVALADCFDSLHRTNELHGRLTGEEIRQKMYDYNPAQKMLIDSLYRENLLTTLIFPEYEE